MSVTHKGNLKGHRKNGCSVYYKLKGYWRPDLKVEVNQVRYENVDQHPFCNEHGQDGLSKTPKQPALLQLHLVASKGRSTTDEWMVGEACYRLKAVIVGSSQNWLSEIRGPEVMLLRTTWKWGGGKVK